MEFHHSASGISARCWWNIHMMLVMFLYNTGQISIQCLWNFCTMLVECLSNLGGIPTQSCWNFYTFLTYLYKVGNLYTIMEFVHNDGRNSTQFCQAILMLPINLQMPIRHSNLVICSSEGLGMSPPSRNYKGQGVAATWTRIWTSNL